MTNETNQSPLSQEEIEVRMEKLKAREIELLKHPGFYITVVPDLGAYTIGLSQDPRTPYEIVIQKATHFASDINHIVAKIREGNFKVDHGAVFTSESFCVRVSGVIAKARYQFVEVSDPDMLERLAENIGFGWKKHDLFKDLTKVFIMEPVDKKNRLPLSLHSGINRFQKSLEKNFPKTFRDHGPFVDLDCQDSKTNTPKSFIGDLDVASMYQAPVRVPNEPKTAKFFFNPYGHFPLALNRVLKERHDILFTLVKQFGKITEPAATEFYKEQDYDRQIEIEKKTAKSLAHLTAVYHMRVKAAKKRKKKQRRN